MYFLTDNCGGLGEIVNILKQTEVLQKGISQVSAFLECATAQNIHDRNLLRQTLKLLYK